MKTPTGEGFSWEDGLKWIFCSHLRSAGPDLSVGSAAVCEECDRTALSVDSREEDLQRGLGLPRHGGAP